MRNRPRITVNCAPGQLRGADGRCGPGIGVSIPRNEMPQIPGNKLQDFIFWGRAKGVTITPGIETASDLSPTQSEFRQERVDAIPQSQLASPCLVSEDNYILDGTHRWIKHWQGSNSAAVPVLKIGLPLQDALTLLREFPGAKFAANQAERKGSKASKRKGKNPLRIDPTRTAGLRRKAVTKLRRLFGLFRGRLRKLIIDDDAFGLKPPPDPLTGNQFNPDQPRDGQGRFTGDGDKGDAPGLAAKFKEKLTATIDAVPGGKWLRERSEALNQKLKERYGDKAAARIVASAVGLSWGAFLIGGAVGYPNYIPTSVAAIPGIVIAELHYRYRKQKDKDSVENAALDFTALGQEFLDAVTTAWRNYLPTHNARQFAFHTTPQALKAFQQWIQTQVDATLLSQNEQNVWQAYAAAGWKQGAGRAWDDAAQAGLQKRRPDLFTPESQDELKGFYAGTRSEFLSSAFNQPVSVERIQTLAGRSFDDIKNVTDDMKTRMSRTLTDGLARGDSPYEVAKDLSADIDISQTRAEVIARTEIIRAHSEGQLDAFDKMGLAEVGVMVEWLATDDDRVCPDCDGMEGTVLEIDEARGMIPFHPNCRCCWLPQNVGEKDQDEPTENQRILNSFCPTGEGGGVDPTCSPNAPSLPKNEKEAAKAIVESLKLTDARVAGSPELQGQILKNWQRNLKGAFKGLDSKAMSEVQSAINANYQNPAYLSAIKKYGPETVIFRNRTSDDPKTGAAHSVGSVSHIIEDKFRSGISNDVPKPGDATSGTSGGLSAEIRHEYGHSIWGKLSSDQKEKIIASMPDSDSRKRGLTFYSAKNHEEGFCEMFATATHPRYDEKMYSQEMGGFARTLLTTIGV